MVTQAAQLLHHSHGKSHEGHGCHSSHGVRQSWQCWPNWRLPARRGAMGKVDTIEQIAGRRQARCRSPSRWRSSIGKSVWSFLRY